MFHVVQKGVQHVHKVHIVKVDVIDTERACIWGLICKFRHRLFSIQYLGNSASRQERAHGYKYLLVVKRRWSVEVNRWVDGLLAAAASANLLRRYLYPCQLSTMLDHQQLTRQSEQSKNENTPIE
ncbi:uncharacterized protein YALI1_B18375g [Yarrowia lipolytica]|uniref:Uncharacterized protein n=1 Tax=Yarrowia lipolytica TaxID=4952 RepID=A0A1D8N7Q5_YARLL|nr:hypothetical protein YALI1_B18375g [Yarrowia lipolytica]